MKKFILPDIPAIICSAAAFTLAYKGMPGWGWFLFAGIILSGGGVFLSKSEKEDAEK